jgi:hypothetical protein
MSKSDNSKLNDSLHELSCDVSQLVIREQQLMNEELLRMSKLLEEAATSLRQCFTVMGQQLEQQASLLQQRDPNVQVERRKDTSKEELLLATSEIGSYVGQAVRALQFEDIIQQLIGHSRRRAEEIEKMFVGLQARINDMQEYDARDLEQVLAVLDRCHKELATVKEALTIANPVKQQSLEKGDVILF